MFLIWFKIDLAWPVTPRSKELNGDAIHFRIIDFVAWFSEARVRIFQVANFFWSGTKFFQYFTFTSVSTKDLLKYWSLLGKEPLKPNLNQMWYIFISKLKSGIWTEANEVWE